jgi:hypothetical protein
VPKLSSEALALVRDLAAQALIVQLVVAMHGVPALGLLTQQVPFDAILLELVTGILVGACSWLAIARATPTIDQWLRAKVQAVSRSFQVRSISSSQRGSRGGSTDARALTATGAVARERQRRTGAGTTRSRKPTADRNANHGPYRWPWRAWRKPLRGEAAQDIACVFPIQATP